MDRAALESDISAKIKGSTAGVVVFLVLWILWLVVMADKYFDENKKLNHQVNNNGVRNFTVKKWHDE